MAALVKRVMARVWASFSSSLPRARLPDLESGPLSETHSDSSQESDGTYILSLTARQVEYIKVSLEAKAPNSELTELENRLQQVLSASNLISASHDSQAKIRSPPDSNKEASEHPDEVFERPDEVFEHPDETPVQQATRELENACDVCRILQKKFDSRNELRSEALELYGQELLEGKTQVDEDKWEQDQLWEVAVLVEDMKDAEKALKEVEKRASDEFGLGLDEAGYVVPEQLIDEDDPDGEYDDDETNEVCQWWVDQVPQEDDESRSQPEIDEWHFREVVFGETSGEQAQEHQVEDLANWREHCEALRSSVEEEKAARRPAFSFWGNDPSQGSYEY